MKPGPGDRFLLTLLKDVKTPAILALNKVDLVAKPKLLPLIDHYQQRASVRGDRAASAVDGTNVDVAREVVPAVPAGRRAALSGRTI